MADRREFDRITGENELLGFVLAKFFACRFGFMLLGEIGVLG